MNIFEYSFVVWFFFYLVNHSELFGGKLEYAFVDYPFGDKIDYAVKCAFCFTWWVSLLAYLIGAIPFYYTFGSAVITLIINLIFLTLVKYSSEPENSVNSDEPYSEIMKTCDELRARCNTLTPERREYYYKKGLEMIFSKKE